MTLGNMRQLGVQRLIASCLNDACRHQGLVDVSGNPADTEVPWFRSRVKCAKCGSRGNKIDVLTTNLKWRCSRLARRRPWEHTARMAKDPKPTFKPLPYKVGTYWRVEVEWPDGVTQHVDDFGSESEALEWISRKSDDWARRHPRSG
jgi:hypothetical protein